MKGLFRRDNGMLPIFLPSILPFPNLLTPILVRRCSSPRAKP